MKKIMIALSLLAMTASAAPQADQKFNACVSGVLKKLTASLKSRVQKDLTNLDLKVTTTAR